MLAQRKTEAFPIPSGWSAVDDTQTKQVSRTTEDTPPTDRDIQRRFLQSILPQEGYWCVGDLYSDKTKAETAPKHRVTNFFHHTEIELALDKIACIEKTPRDSYIKLCTFINASTTKSPNVEYCKTLFLDIDCREGKDYASKEEGLEALAEFCTRTGFSYPVVVNSGGGLHVYWMLDETLFVDDWQKIVAKFKTFLDDPAHPLRSEQSILGTINSFLRVPNTLNKKIEGNPRRVEVVSWGAGELNTAWVKHQLADIQAPVTVERGTYSGRKGENRVMDALTSDFKDLTFRFSRILNKSTRVEVVTEEHEEEYEMSPGLMGTRVVKTKVEKSLGCPQLLFCVTNSATLAEPLWTAALSIAEYCVDKREAIIAVSKNYPNTTEDTWVEKAGERAAPNTCKHWGRLENGHLCTTCIHKGKLHTPISLGRTIEEASPEDNSRLIEHAGLDGMAQVQFPSRYPFPFFRPKTGGIAVRGNPNTTQTEADNGEAEEYLIYENDLWISTYADDGDQKYVVIALMLPNSKLIEFPAPMVTLMKNDTLLPILAAKGVHVVANPKKLDMLKRYMSAWIGQLQNQGPPKIAYNQFGWHDNYSKFVIGHREIDSKGVVSVGPVTNSVESVASIYSVKGSLDAWKEVANTYNKPGNEAKAFALFCSLGAPFYNFLGEGSMIVHLTNIASGVGKSTAQRIAASVWGDPRKSLLIENDTANAKLHRAGILRHIVLLIDEITNMAPEAASRLTFDISAGRGKNRLQAHHNMERRNDSTWETICITSGNTSLYDIVKQHRSQAEGEMLRILEVPMPADDTLSKAEADRLFARLLPNNYGMVGEMLMCHVMPGMEKMLPRLFDYQVSLDLELGIAEAKTAGEKSKDHQKERFYSACFTAAFFGAEMANNIGLIDIPVAPVKAWVRDLVHGARKNIGAAIRISDNKSAASVVSLYWNKNISFILVVKDSPNQDAHFGTRSTVVVDFRGYKIVGRHNITTNRLYLDQAAFLHQMQQDRLPTAQLMRKLETEGVFLGEEQINLGEGEANCTTAPVPVYVFDAAKLSTGT